MSKRGQTTLFIILGVVIVIIIGLYALVGYGIINKKFIYSQQLNDKQNDIDEYIKECIRNVIKEKLKTIGIENINFNSLEDDPDIKNCFNLNQFKDGFDIITVENPNINVNYLDDNLEFGIIYPVTISKAKVNVTLNVFNIVQSLKSCGVDYNSVDNRLNIRSNAETCVTLTRISSNTLAPVYEIKSLEPQTSQDIILSFSSLTKDSVIAQEINEDKFIAVNSEKSSINGLLNSIEKSPSGIEKKEKKEVIKAAVTPGNFSLIEKINSGEIVNIGTQNPILPIASYTKPSIGITTPTPVIIQPIPTTQQLNQLKCSKIKETGCVWIFDNECDEYSRGIIIGKCGPLNLQTKYNCYEDKLSECSSEPECDEDEIVAEETECTSEQTQTPHKKTEKEEPKLEEVPTLTITTPTTPTSTVPPTTQPTPSQPSPGILVASTFDEEKVYQGERVYLYYHIKLENKGGSPITIKNGQKCYSANIPCDTGTGLFGGKTIQPEQSITLNTKEFIWFDSTQVSSWTATVTWYGQDSLGNPLEASYTVSVSK